MSDNWGNPVTSRRASVLSSWLAAKLVLEKAKVNEAELRAELIRIASDVADVMATGTENVDMPGGKLKIVRKLNYGFTCDADKLDGILDQIEKSVEGGNIIADRLVKWKPELSLSEYKLLNGAQKKLIDAVIEAKPATPAVTFEPTKG